MGRDGFEPSRLEVVRCFAKYCCINDPNTQIPAQGIFGKSRRRTIPFIFSKNEIQQTLEKSKHLAPQDGLRPISFRYLFGLLYVTGLRISEALNLSPKDVDLKQGILTIRQTKFNMSRLVPLQKSTVTALMHYCRYRDKYINAYKDLTAWFISVFENLYFFSSNTCQPIIKFDSTLR